MNNNKNATRSGLMMAVAAYIIYLGISILTGLKDSDNQTQMILLGIAAVAFVVCGGALLVYHLKGLLKALKEDRESEGDVEIFGETIDAAGGQKIDAGDQKIDANDKKFDAAAQAVDADVQNET